MQDIESTYTFGGRLFLTNITLRID